MTVAELIERLEEYGGDVEVRLAIQPNYPLQSTVRGVASSDDADTGDEGNVVWIVEGSQCEMPYAPREVFEDAS